jgi:hypothetical protein
MNNEQRAHDLAVAIYASLVKENDDVNKMALNYVGLYATLLAKLDEAFPQGLQDLSLEVVRAEVEKFQH